MFSIETNAGWTVLNLVWVKFGVGHFSRALGSTILESSRVFKITSGPTFI